MDSPGGKLHANGCLTLGMELVPREAREEIGFSYPRVSNQDHYKKTFFFKLQRSSQVLGLFFVWFLLFFWGDGVYNLIRIRIFGFLTYVKYILQHNGSYN